MTILETVTPRDSLTLKATRGGATGEHKYFIEEKSGWQLHHDTGEWRHIEQVVDRENDRYRKLVIGEDGTVHRDIDEPLSAHFGRGDAKKQEVSGHRAPRSPLPTVPLAISSIRSSSFSRLFVF